MNKYLVICGIIMLGFLAVSMAEDSGLINNLLGEQTTASTVKVDMQLKPETRDALRAMQTTSEQVCVKEETNCLEWETRPVIECMKWEDDKQLNCLEWEDYKLKGCLEFDSKIGECTKWETELKCLKQETVCTEYKTVDTNIGIEKVTITPKGNNCYDIISEPMLHRYNTCLNAGENVTEFVKKDLEMIAENKKLEDARSKAPAEEVIEITIQ